MALQIHSLRDRQPGGEKVVPGKRLYLTAEGDALVEHGDPAAAFLYCTEEQSVSKEEYEALSGQQSKGATEKERTAGTEDKNRSKARSTKSKSSEQGGD